MNELDGLGNKISEAVTKLRGLLDEAEKTAWLKRHVLIQSVNDEQLASLAERIRPVRTIKGKHYFLKMDCLDLRSASLSYTKLPREKSPASLGWLFDITTFHHPRGYAGFFDPKYAETVAQIPALFRELDLVVGFEVDPDSEPALPIYFGYQIARTRLYTT